MRISSKLFVLHEARPHYIVADIDRLHAHPCLLHAAPALLHSTPLPCPAPPPKQPHLNSRRRAALVQAGCVRQQASNMPPSGRSARGPCRPGEQHPGRLHPSALSHLHLPAALASLRTNYSLGLDDATKIWQKLTTTEESNLVS